MSFEQMAVSYTHLDVYKRQLPEFLNYLLTIVHQRLLSDRIQTRNGGLSTSVHTPVSYTHRDVYKGQDRLFD